VGENRYEKIFLRGEIMKSKLRQLRILSGFTQHELGQVVGLHYSAVCRIEKGMQRPNERQKIAIAEFFKIDKEIIFPEAK
jgi:DNA-binding XRE family transcriptional regulator